MQVDLVQTVAQEKTLDDVYEQRTWLFVLACNLATEVNCLKQKLEYRHGERPEPKYELGCRERGPDWSVAVLHLPGQGEVAIHARTMDLKQAPYPWLRDYPAGWDGSNALVERIRQFTKHVQIV